ncbi:MAG: 3-oxoacyl-[acyl-carrier-protein] synthase 2 [Phycisphaeraceae bacterium]|nr:MAG: 3-oxoacyl-[acyl-carrier-protein] synthase 2 [Phycisphaeraceae bacterium]
MCITGLGPVSCIGSGVDAFWASLLEGRSGLGPVEVFDPAGFASRLAGAVTDVSVRDSVPKSYRKATKVMARDTELAVVAAKLAADDAGLVTRGSDDGDEGFAITPERTGCQIGAGLIAAEADELTRALVTSLDDEGVWDVNKWGTAEGGESGMNNLPPLWMLKYLPNMLACHVTIIHGTEGPSNTILAAESSGLLCLGEGARVIERNDADVSFVGGAESKLNLMGLMRLELLGRLAHTHDATDGAQVVKPYDPDAGGTVLAEGGGIVILEELGHAKARGARVYAEVAGFGASQSDRKAETGLELAIASALRDAGVGPGDIDAIFPTGIGLAGPDAHEAGAFRAVFGDRLAEIPIVSLAPVLGDSMAGQGGLQAAAAALAVHHQTLPARVHTGTPGGGLDAGASDARDASLGCVLVCTTAMGGQNAAAVLKRPG